MARLRGWVLAAAALAGGGSDAKPMGVEFVGKAPKFKVFPKGEADSTWMMLEFGKIQEVEPDGRPVQSHSIRSLASESPTFTEGDTTLNGADVRQVTMTLDLPFDKSDCGAGPQRGSGGGGSGGGGLEALEGGSGRRLGEGSITIKTFIFASSAEIPYDEYSLFFEAGQLKFNIESRGWPFCAPENSLTVEMAVRLQSDEEAAPSRAAWLGTPQRPSPEGKPKPAPGGGPDGASPPPAGKPGPPPGGKPRPEGSGRRPPRAKVFEADGGARGVVMDLPELVLLDGAGVDSTVAMEDRGGAKVIKFTFPAFASTLLYDPAVSFEDDSSETNNSGRRCVALAVSLGLVAGVWLRH